MAPIEGGCLCGRVRYRADVEPIFVGVCHCTDCQKFSGSTFATVVAVPASAVTVTGTLKTFTKLGGSGKPIHRCFCPDCGSSVLDRADALPNVVMIGTGTLDDPSWVRPQSQIFCASAQSWVRLGGDIKGFAKLPA